MTGRHNRKAYIQTGGQKDEKRDVQKTMYTFKVSRLFVVDRIRSCLQPQSVIKNMSKIFVSVFRFSPCNRNFDNCPFVSEKTIVGNPFANESNGSTGSNRAKKVPVCEYWVMVRGLLYYIRNFLSHISPFSRSSLIFSPFPKIGSPPLFPSPRFLFSFPSFLFFQGLKIALSLPLPGLFGPPPPG